MKRLQIYLPEGLLENLRLYAQSRGIPLAEALRQAGKEFSNKPLIRKQIREAQFRKKKKVKNPYIAMAGMLGKGPANASMTVDDVYDD